ncbi:MAG: UDP-N-acetylmuramate--L-alanine ligase, partial [Polaromonas sp.]
VDEIDALPQTILDNAQGGDVVMCMGAGSIGLVPGKVVGILDAAAHALPAGVQS